MSNMQKDRQEEPRDARAKVTLLRTYALPRHFPAAKTTIRDLAEYAGISRENLRDQLNKTRRLSTSVQSALARKLKFGVDWPEWQTGTVEEFKKRYQSAHPDSQPP